MQKAQIDLLNVLGLQLTGKDVRVRERKPATKGLLGEIHRDRKGQLLIDISPEITTNQKRLHIILHEFAHAKHHVFIKSDWNEIPPESVARDPLDSGDMIREGTAEKQAAVWKAWGEAKARALVPDFYKIAPFEATLIALMAYKEDK